MRLLLCLVASLLGILAAACSSDDADPGMLRVVATTTQIGDFARNAGGDRISLTVLLKPNQDAHDFEPEPSQLRALSQADVVLRNGIGLDAFVSKALQESSAKVIAVTGGLDLLEGEAHAEEAGEEHDEEAEAEAGGYDPHVWFSVANAGKMVESIRDALGEADAANASYYATNATAYLTSLSQLDKGIKAQVATIPAGCRKLVTNHDVLGYYAQAYGFEVVGSVIPATTTGAQASAAGVADIVRKIRAERVPAIFAEASGNPALIQQVGREAGVKVVDDLYGDSLGEPGSEGATYIAMMESNTRKIVEGLKGCLV
ncbi:MAG: zinc ABC transporter substrate-binding protein [Dehalococcoidia bacterium]|nr:zinc ABC transporter substrate-binding protein [Dehalococcoidia bacterium]